MNLLENSKQFTPKTETWSERPGEEQSGLESERGEQPGEVDWRREWGGAPALRLPQTRPGSHPGLGQVVHEPVASEHQDVGIWSTELRLPVDEVDLPPDVPHLEPGERLRDEAVAPERHLCVLVAPVCEAAENSG